VPIDLVNLFARGLTIYEAPVNIISKLYRFVKPQDGTELPMQALRKLIVAFCASKVSLIDIVVPDIVPQGSHIKRRKRY